MLLVIVLYCLHSNFISLSCYILWILLALTTSWPNGDQLSVMSAKNLKKLLTVNRCKIVTVIKNCEIYKKNDTTKERHQKTSFRQKSATNGQNSPLYFLNLDIVCLFASYIKSNFDSYLGVVLPSFSFFYRFPTILSSIPSF